MNTGLSDAYWQPQPDTFQPSTDRVQEIHEGIVDKIFPNQETLNQYPDIIFALGYKRRESWPQITIGSQDDFGHRMISIDLFAIEPATILRYEIDQAGNVILLKHSTDSRDKNQFENRIEGLQKSLSVADKKEVLGRFVSSKHSQFS